MNRRFRCLAIVAASLGLLAFVPSAQADGGKTIATSTPIVVGQLQSGNSANGTIINSGTAPQADSWWNLAVTAGDTVTIDWEMAPYSDLNVYSVGITDFTWHGSDLVAQGQNSAISPQSELTFTAPVTGVMPMLFQTGPTQVGPYSFTVRIIPKPCPSGQTGTPPNCVTPPPVDLPAVISAVRATKVGSAQLRFYYDVDETAWVYPSFYVGGRKRYSTSWHAGAGTSWVNIGRRGNSWLWTPLAKARRRGRALAVTLKIKAVDDGGNVSYRTTHLRIR